MAGMKFNRSAPSNIADDRPQYIGIRLGHERTREIEQSWDHDSWRLVSVPSSLRQIKASVLIAYFSTPYGLTADRLPSTPPRTRQQARPAVELC